MFRGLPGEEPAKETGKMASEIQVSQKPKEFIEGRMLSFVKRCERSSGRG